MKSARSLLAACFAAATLATILLPCRFAGADARGEARAELTRVRIAIERELRARPEMQEAKLEWVGLRREYEALRRLVVNDLNADSVYLGTRQELWQTQDALNALADEYRNGIIPRERNHAMSLKILELRLKLSRIEQAALAKHHDTMLARQAYLAAAKRLAQLHRELREDVRSDPRFEAALGQLLELRGGGGSRFIP